ncbi:hypothetical protein GE09DRAFT_1151158 [Coniochaeta sp. 2T2.1]|nr:hypothetical protein GE09DRAFT_1151158 [Coniochaeta sp. 2T2.1]
MRVNSLPLSLSRFSVPQRRTWQYFGLAVIFVLLLSSFSSNRREQITDLLPPKLRPQPTKALRPGDYADTSRQRPVPDTGDEPPLVEADGVGTLHDQRDGRFYQAGVHSLTSDEAPPRQVVFDPYPDYNREQWRRTWKGDFVACKGPRGTILDRTKPEDTVSVYRGNQQDFPFPMFGSHESIGLDANVCADRCARWSAYGYVEEGSLPPCPKSVQVNWDRVNWGTLQAQCTEKNANRYKDATHTVHQTLLKPFLWIPPPAAEKVESAAGSQPEYHSRTAIIVRSWSTMDWTASHRQYLRSLIMELALHSGGEYQLFLLVDVKVPIDLRDESAVKRLKTESVPAEFHDITVLFNEEVLAEWYPKIEEHTAVYQHLQPIQIFSQLHPSFDFYWQFEMDARNTGHTYHFLEQAASFAKRQPRKYLWERNAYFYIPGAYGTWENFVHMVDRTMKGREETSVWGPVSAPGANIKPVGPSPPVANPRHENYEWGVGEEADLITLLPIFDAKDTNWTFPDMIWNAAPDLPRRASPITMWRMSRQLLGVMHAAAVDQGMAVVSEMSAPTFALLHGLKAVAAPHPIYLDGQWMARELAPIVNRGSDPSKINGDGDSLWNWDHKWDHILFRMSYMFTTQTAEDLIRRWLGYKADENQYTDGSLHRDPQGRFWYDEGRLEEERFGRLCFPMMFVHTVKNTERVKGKDMAVPV